MQAEADLNSQQKRVSLGTGGCFTGTRFVPGRRESDTVIHITSGGCGFSFAKIQHTVRPQLKIKPHESVLAMKGVVFM